MYQNMLTKCYSGFTCKGHIPRLLNRLPYLLLYTMDTYRAPIAGLQSSYCIILALQVGLQLIMAVQKIVFTKHLYFSTKLFYFLNETYVVFVFRIVLETTLMNDYTLFWNMEVTDSILNTPCYQSGFKRQDNDILFIQNLRNLNVEDIV